MVSKKDKFLAAAQKFLERGQLDKALAEFGKVLQEDPKDTRTLLKIAELHAKRSDVEKATEVYLKTADVYTEQGFFQKAVAVFKNVLKLNPGYVQGHFKLADLYKQLGLLQDAMNQLEVAASVLVKSGRVADALDALRQIVELQPDNVVSRIKLAEAAVQAGANEEAVQGFGRAADQLKAQGRTDEYLKVAERLLFYQPENLALARELAEAYIARKNARFALPKLQACFKADPRDPLTLSLLAKAFEQLGQIPKTISVLKELARVCHETGRNAERNDAVRKVIALDANDADARSMATRYGMTGMIQRPGSSSSATPLSSPGTGGGFSRPGTGSGSSRPGTGAGVPGLHFDSGGSSASIDRRGIEAESEEIQRILSESEVFVKYGLLERAADHLRRVFETKPKHVGAREKLVAVLVQLGRISDAVAELETMAEQLATGHAEDAAEFARRALALDPRSVRARALLDAVERGATPAPARIALPEAAPEPDMEMEVEIGSAGNAGPALDAEDAGPEIEIAESSGIKSDVAAEIVEVGEDGFDTPNSSAPLLEVVSGDAETSEELVDAAEELPASEFAEAQRTAAGEFDREQKTPPGGSEFDAPSWSGAGPGADEEEFEGGRTIFAEDIGLRAPGKSPHGETVDPDLAAEIESVDFFVQQGMFEEARASLQDLGDRYPGNSLLADKLVEVEMAAGAAHGAVPQPPGEPVSNPERPRAVLASGDEADLATHKDLGIAYQQMGLHDAAIAEFTFLCGDPKHEVWALEMMGECHEAKGSLTDAVMQYKRALNSSAVDDEETTRLYYLLGNVYDRLEDVKEALYFLEKVAKRDPEFRDTAARIEALRAPRSGPGAGANGQAGGGGRGPSPSGDDFDAAFDSLMGDSSPTNATHRPPTGATRPAALPPSRPAAAAPARPAASPPARPPAAAAPVRPAAGPARPGAGAPVRPPGALAPTLRPAATQPLSSGGGLAMPPRPAPAPARSAPVGPAQPAPQAPGALPPRKR